MQMGIVLETLFVGMRLAGKAERYHQWSGRYLQLTVASLAERIERYYQWSGRLRLTGRCRRWAINVDKQTSWAWCLQWCGRGDLQLTEDVVSR
jgi:hypothetical protein